MARKRSTMRFPQYKVADATTVPAPVGGLNDRDSIANMPATDAVILENWWPEPSRLSIRKGRTRFATGLPGAVETIAEYSPVSGQVSLFAACGGAIYNVTSGGPVGDPVVEGLANNRWQSAAATTIGGSFMYLFNGVDKPLLYGGDEWKSIDATSDPAITGIDTTSIISGCVFKNRLYLVEKNSLNVWYLPFTSIGGEAKPLPLGTVFQRGGFIRAIYSWTIDAGAGADDHIVVISSNGEVAVYSGSDPDTLGSFKIVGVFRFGRPVGARCGIKFGGDLLIICEDGVFPLAQALLTASIDRRVAITDKIQNSIHKEVRARFDTFGWELCLSPENSAVMLNVPGSQGNSYQFAQNTLTGAWTKFTGMGAYTIVNTALGVYSGGSGTIYKMWQGNLDDGAPIVADALPAFGYFGSVAQTKFFTRIRPYLQTSGTPSIQFGLNGDFNPQAPSGTLPYVPPSGMVWGQMVWGQMVWGGSVQQLQDWATVGGVFKAASIRLRIQGNGAEVDWLATDFSFTRGGLL